MLKKICKTVAFYLLITFSGDATTNVYEQSFCINRTDEGKFLLCGEITPELRIESLDPRNEEAKNSFFECLKSMISNPNVMRHFQDYGNGVDFSDPASVSEFKDKLSTIAEQKAKANVNIHLTTYDTGLPRFSIIFKNELVGFVRLGNSSLCDDLAKGSGEKFEWFKQALKEQGLSIEDLSKGVGEVGAMIDERFQGQGLGSKFVPYFLSTIIPQYQSSDILFSNGIIQYVYFTYSPKNNGSKKLAERFLPKERFYILGEYDQKIHCIFKV